MVTGSIWMLQCILYRSTNILRIYEEDLCFISFTTPVFDSSSLLYILSSVLYILVEVSFHITRINRFTVVSFSVQLT